MKKYVIGILLLVVFISGVCAYDFYKPPFKFQSATSFQDAARLQVENQALEYIHLLSFLKTYGYDLDEISISIETGFSNTGTLGSVKYEFSTRNKNINFNDLMIGALSDIIIANGLTVDVVKFVNDGLPGGARRGFIDPESNNLGVLFFRYDYDPSNGVNKFFMTVPNSSIFGQDYNLLTHVWPVDIV